ncbi:hypothetical protein IMZ48_47640 [Candidatus Bathyarchaeota archaeon]|nr:hypothetical protein [Candidatus Bathyarchaeota archaeon]
MKRLGDRKMRHVAAVLQHPAFVAATAASPSEDIAYSLKDRLRTGA